MTALDGLDTGLFVGGENTICGLQWLALPEALIEVEDATGLDLEIGIARKDPAAMGPGANRVLCQPSPQGGLAHGCDDAAFQDSFLNSDMLHLEMGR